ncbi:dihydrofolate reductase family protein [Nonomuraea sp. NPDC005501]|uniref:dihydrofolate reductase family protein n=1 Tax=Nonomuraea sp. NPDC005501 TaxID=3156884 RepID=UPI0033AAB1D7
MSRGGQREGPGCRPGGRGSTGPDRNRPARNFTHGGTWFARSLVEPRLIDECRLLVHPAVLGASEPIFPASLSLELASTTIFSGGAVAHVFAAQP